MRSAKFLLPMAVALLSACATSYSLVGAGAIGVSGNAMQVVPERPWNRAPKSPVDVSGVERWTQNGLGLDSLTFAGGIVDGQALTRQKPKDARKVPVFRENMSPQDLVSMLESYYRVAAGIAVFDVKGVDPITMLGRPGVRIDFVFVGSDEVRRKGRAVLSIVEGKLYMIMLDAAAMHYFDAAIPEFERLVLSASLK